MMGSLLRAVLLGVVGFACVGCETELALSPADERAAFVLAHVDQAHVTFSYRVSESDTRDVRNFHVMLYGPPMRVEPGARYPDGLPAGSARQIPADAMRMIVQALQDDGFFNKSERYHSEAIASPQSNPPADSIDFIAATHPTTFPSGALEVKLVTMVGEWHHYFIHAHPLDTETRNLIHGICEGLPEAAGRDVEQGILGRMR